MVLSRRQFTNGSLAAALCTLSSCSGGGDSDQESIAVLFDGLYSPFWIAGQEAIVSDLKSRGFRVFEAISDQKDSKQLTQVKSMIAQGVKGIVIVHTDRKKVISAIREANMAGVPMVHFNRAPAESEFFSVAIRADNRKITRETVEHMVSVAKKRGGKSKAAILIGDLGDSNAISRRDGFFDVVDQHADMIEVVSRIPTNWKEDKAFEGLTNAFTANPDIDFLFTSSDFLFPQIVQAMKKADKWYPIGDERHVIFGGFDGDRTAYDLLQSGYLDADGVQELEYEAKLCVDAILDMTTGKLTRKAGASNPLIINDPGFAIHQENLMEVRDRMWGYKLWEQEQTA